MDLKALFRNVTISLQTTRGLGNAFKRLLWLYNRSGREKTLIKFNYPPPIGKVDLTVRDNSGADSFIISEVFEQQCYYLPLKKLSRIIDLGANAGFTAVYFSKLFPQATIACIEPMPANIEILKDNIILNNVNAEIFEAAATVTNQQITMEVADKDYANKVHNIPFGKPISQNTILVKGLSIDTILDRLDWQNVDLLKIDIEGYEAVLLSDNNSWLDKVSVIIMEIHEGVTIELIKKYTAPYGFAYTSLQRGNWIISKTPLF